MDTRQFEERKKDHLRHSLDPANQAHGLSGLDAIRIHHEPLPEVDFDEIRLESRSLGKQHLTPFFIAGMTAGHPDASDLNLRLAAACARRGWAMGVGSQRRELTGEVVDAWREVHERHPGVPLFANIGLSQAIETADADLERLIGNLRAEALCVHLNPLQEALQPEGTPRFRGGLKRLNQICSALKTPVILKETGCGFSPPALRKVAALRLAAVDVSGLGGTHWGRIEGARAARSSGAHSGAPVDPLRAAAARTFAEWGEPTVESVLSAAEILPESIEIWATGGVRTGLDAAKLIALGSTRVGFAKPALEAALEGDAALERWMVLREFELMTALFCAGAATPGELREKEEAWTINES